VDMNTTAVTQEMTEQYKFLSNLLKKNVIEILFLKTDGTERKMKCTLMHEYLPAVTEAKESTRKVSTTSLPVWDLEENAWRSFRIDSLIMYTYVDTRTEIAYNVQ